MRKILQQAIDIAISQGAEQADVVLSSGDALSAKAEGKEISDYKVNSFQSVGIRVVKDHKIGLSYCESFAEDSLRDMVKQSLQNVKFSSVEPTENITVQRSDAIDGTADFAFSESRVDPSQLVEKALEYEALLTDQDTRLKLPPYNAVGEYFFQTLYLNHLGTFCSEKQKVCSAFTSALIEDGEKNAMHVSSLRSRNFKELDFKKSANEAYQHALALLEASPIKTGNYDVVFSVDMLNSFLGAFSNLFSGRSAVNELNPFKDKVGTAVASDLLSIVDRPLMENTYGYSIFDMEGNLTQETSLVEKGVLKGFYHNSSTSEKLGCKNTHNAARSAKSSLGTTGANQVILAGATKENDIIGHDHFEVVQLKGLHSGCNSITGDFSFGASGYWYKNGKQAQAVKGVTISGNVFTLLKNILMVGDELYEAPSGDFFAPKIVFAELCVAGE